LRLARAAFRALSSAISPASRTLPRYIVSTVSAHTHEQGVGDIVDLQPQYARHTAHRVITMGDPPSHVQLVDPLSVFNHAP
jgi:hypothetical protein